MRSPMRLRNGIAAAIVCTATMALMVNGPAAHAAYDMTGCHAPAGGTCVTGAIQPHSTEHWLLLQVDAGNNNWGLYDWTEGEIRVDWCYGYGSGGNGVKCYDLDPSHYYELWVGSANGANGYLSNYT